MVREISNVQKVLDMVLKRSVKMYDQKCWTHSGSGSHSAARLVHGKVFCNETAQRLSEDPNAALLKGQSRTVIQNTCNEPNIGK